MDATLTNTLTENALRAIELGKLLHDHNGGETLVMDMRPLNFWTDFFVIATTTSSTHLYGLERRIKEFTSEQGMEILHHSQKLKNDVDGQSAEWHIVDLGSIVVHLMSAKARTFFELERLWSTAPHIYEAETGTA